MTESRPARVYGEVRKNARETIRITAAEYLGHTFTDLRVWVQSEGVWTPTRKGVGIKLDLLPAVIEALQTALTDDPGRG